MPRNRYPSQREVAAIMGHGIAATPEIARGPPEVATAANRRGQIPPLPKEHEFTPSDLTSSTYMSTVALGEALLAATNQGADPFDVVFFDQCFQGSIDVLYEVQKTGRVFVASPNYAWLVAAYDKYITQFSPAATPATLASNIIDAYQGSLDGSHPNAIFWVKSSDIQSSRTRSAIWVTRCRPHCRQAAPNSSPPACSRASTWTRPSAAGRTCTWVRLTN